MYLTDDYLKELKVSIGQRIILNNAIKLINKEKTETEEKEKENHNILNMDVVCYIIKYKNFLNMVFFKN